MNPESVLLVALSVFVLVVPVAMVAALAYGPRILPHLRGGAEARTVFPRPEPAPRAVRASTPRRHRPASPVVSGRSVAA